MRAVAAAASSAARLAALAVRPPRLVAAAEASEAEAEGDNKSSAVTLFSAAATAGGSPPAAGGGAALLVFPAMIAFSAAVREVESLRESKSEVSILGPSSGKSVTCGDAEVGANEPSARPPLPVPVPAGVSGADASPPPPGEGGTIGAAPAGGGIRVVEVLSSSSVIAAADGTAGKPAAVGVAEAGVLPGEGVAIVIVDGGSCIHMYRTTQSYELETEGQRTADSGQAGRRAGIWIGREREGTGRVPE